MEYHVEFDGTKDQLIFLLVIVEFSISVMCSVRAS
jgi:hypothetical protein